MKIFFTGIVPNIKITGGACESMNIDSHTAYDYILNIVFVKQGKKISRFLK